MDQSRWERLKGDLLSARDVYRGTKIWDPFRQEYVEIRTSPGDSGAPAQDPYSVQGRLAYLKTLFVNGLIDASDYEYAKRRVLEGIVGGR